MRHDGSVYVADSAVTGWTRYGQGTPALPSGLGYSGVALGPDGLPGYVYVVSEEGKAYVADSAVRGWTQYGQGTPNLPKPGGHSALTGVAPPYSSSPSMELSTRRRTTATAGPPSVPSAPTPPDGGRYTWRTTGTCTPCVATERFAPHPAGPRPGPAMVTRGPGIAGWPSRPMTTGTCTP